jgi:hypothetical protein
MGFPFLPVYRASSPDTRDGHVALGLANRALVEKTYFLELFAGDVLQEISTTALWWQAAHRRA